jgi:hypothetical protein
LHKVIINLQRERENNIYVYAFRLDNRVDGRVTCLFYQEREREREREKTLLVLIISIAFFPLEMNRFFSHIFLQKRYPDVQEKRK